MHLVNVADFRKSVLEFHSGPSGYAFVFDNEGTAIIHPKIQGVNILRAKDLPNEYLEEMNRRKVEDHLRESKARYHSVMQAAPDRHRGV